MSPNFDTQIKRTRIFHFHRKYQINKIHQSHQCHDMNQIHQIYQFHQIHQINQKYKQSSLLLC